MVVVLVAVVEVYSPPEYFLPDYFAINNSDSNSSSNHFALLVLVSWKSSSSSNHLALLVLLLFLIIQVDYHVRRGGVASASFRIPLSSCIVIRFLYYILSSSGSFTVLLSIILFVVFLEI